jgi:transcriptional regulator with XRE-family HTH domain
MAKTSIDTHIGTRIRQRRLLLGLSQQKLAQRIGLAFQQVQKYETGASKVSPGRLIALSEALDVPLMFFFDGLADLTPSRTGTVTDDPFKNRETLEMVRAFTQLPEGQRQAVLSLVKAMADRLPVEGAHNGSRALEERVAD